MCVLSDCTSEVVADLCYVVLVVCCILYVNTYAIVSRWLRAHRAVQSGGHSAKADVAPVIYQIS